MSCETISDREVFWSRFACDFESRAEYVAGRGIINDINNMLLKQGKLGRVLELACGNGTYTKALSRISGHVVATDLSGEMLSVAECRLTSCENVSFDRINCLDVPYQNNSFDTVFMANLIHVISDPVRVLLESRRLIKPGGRIIIVSFTGEGMSFFNKLAMMYRYLKMWGKPPKNARSFTVSALEKQLKSTGFLINDAKLIGENTKALFISAEKA